MKTVELTSALIRAVAAHTGLSERIIRSRRKPHAVCKARWACWIVMRDLGYPVAEIGGAFNRDHGAVVQGIARGKSLTGDEGKLFTELCAAARAAINQTKP